MNEQTSTTIRLSLDYSEVLKIVGALNYRANRLSDMADMTTSKEKSKAMRAESVELALLAGELMKQSEGGTR